MHAVADEAIPLARIMSGDDGDRQDRIGWGAGTTQELDKSHPKVYAPVD